MTQTPLWLAGPVETGRTPASWGWPPEPHCRGLLPVAASAVLLPPPSFLALHLIRDEPVCFGTQRTLVPKTIKKKLGNSAVVPSLGPQVRIHRVCWEYRGHLADRGRTNQKERERNLRRLESGTQKDEKRQLLP